MPVSNKNIGAAIARLRIEKGLTQQQLAAILGVSHQAVSKWENGSALPDLDSLVDIAHLFGMTLDQLINNEEEEDSPRPRVRKSGFFANLIDDDVIDSIKSAAGSAYKAACSAGKAVGNTVTDAYNAVANACREAGAGKDEPIDPDGKTAGEEGAAEENAEASAQDTMSIEGLLDLAPFIKRERLAQRVMERKEEMTPELLEQFAPFLPRETMAELIEYLGQENIPIDTLIRFAPFLGRDKLSEIILLRASELDMQKLRQLAPFLRRGMVDALMDAVNGVKKVVTSENIGKAARATCDTAKDMLDKLRDAVEKQDYGTAKANGEGAHVSQSLRDSVGAAALEAGNWSWLKQHVSELSDAELIKNVCVKAAGETENADAADVLLMTAPYLESKDASDVLDSLIQAGAWEQVICFCPFADSDVCVKGIAAAAESGHFEAVPALAARITPEQLDEITRTAVQNGSWDLINVLPL